MHILSQTKFRPGLQYLAGLQRPRGTTSVNALQRTGMSRKDALGLLRALEAEGHGGVILGRRGGRTRLVWNDDVVGVARSAARAGAPAARALAVLRNYEADAARHLQVTIRRIERILGVRP